jgi:arylsulfatase A-like enzyme
MLSFGVPGSTRAHRVLLFVLTVVVACARGETSTSRPRGFLLLVLDTLRADRLSVYGNPRQTSPTIDALAADGIVFERAQSLAPWTLPSFLGLLSGSYPAGRQLGTSLVESLEDAGYGTAAFTEGGFVSRVFGMDRGFDLWWEEEGVVRLDAEGGGRSGIEHTFQAAIDWLERNHERPFFLMVHTYEPHLPYRRREYVSEIDRGTLSATFEIAHHRAIRDGRLEAGSSEVDYVRALYDGGVRAADRGVGRLLEALAEAGLSDEVVVVVTSDHGEDLGDRDPRILGGHGHGLHDELLRVPLVVYDPHHDYPIDSITDQVRLIDVLPTLLELAGVQPPAGIAGRSLVPMMLGDELGNRFAYAGFPHGRYPERFAAVSDGRWKLIANLASDRAVPRLELYDLTRDPEERHNLVHENRQERNRLAGALAREQEAIRRLAASSYQPAAELSDRHREQLRALGYLDGEAAPD